jgi:nitrate/TMAO reductase-like tetraheme cytochrome c subunit
MLRNFNATCLAKHENRERRRKYQGKVKRGLQFLTENTNVATVNASERVFPFMLLSRCDLGSATETSVVFSRNSTEEFCAKDSRASVLENLQCDNYNVFKGVYDLIPDCLYFLSDMSKFLYKSPHNTLKQM